MRKIKILKVNPTSNTPGSIEVSGDFSQVFQGKFYRNSAGTDFPSYTTPAPEDSTLVKATTFEIVENSTYSGRYTVFTATTDLASSTFEEGSTTILVNEAIQTVDGASLTDGYITNISTYLLDLGNMQVIVPPTVDIVDYPIEFMGRDSAGWGEAFTQNFVDVARNFANPIAPVNAFVGMEWYNNTDKQVRVWDGSAWSLLNQASYGTTYRHVQAEVNATWTVSHSLGLAAPYIAFVEFFVDRGNGPKLIIPSDVTFDSANQLTVTFSNPEKGWVLVRQ